METKEIIIKESANKLGINEAMKEAKESKLKQGVTKFGIAFIKLSHAIILF